MKYAIRTALFTAATISAIAYAWPDKDDAAYNPYQNMSACEKTHGDGEVKDEPCLAEYGDEKTN